MPKARALKKSKRGILSRWKRHIVVNSMQARLRAQLGDRSNYSGERRRRSVVVASINSLDHNRPSTRLTPSFVLTPSCAHSHLRSFIRLHGVNHNKPLPTATSLHTIFTSFTIFIVFQCFHRRHVPTLWCYRLVDYLMKWACCTS